MPEIIENLVSTIIPVYNRPGFLREAVESVLSQTYRPIEIIISDDGSTDDTLQVIRDLTSQYSSIVRVISNPNRGPGPAREAGRQIARGEYIQYLDSDDKLLFNKFENQVLALTRNPECGVVYGISRLIDISGKVLSAPYKWTGQKFDYLFPKLLIDRWWCTHTPLYRRSICDRVGPWTGLIYSQDWEYDSRVGALNVKLFSIDNIVSDHRTHSGKKQTGNGKWLLPKDRVRFFKSLFSNALKANVSTKSPEMKHFSRWAFMQSRQCGKIGDAKSAKACFEIAMKSGGYSKKDTRLYGILSNYVGWKLLGRFTCYIDERFLKRPGSESIKQSWMND